MSFHLLLLLLLSGRSECLTVGKEFIGAFFENVANYYPILPENKLRVIALYDGTLVTITPTYAFMNTSSTAEILNSGDIREYFINFAMELDRTIICEKVVTITSSSDIAVEIVSLRSYSIQTALLFPTDQLGMIYQIPAIPITAAEGTAMTDRSSFKLIVVNNQQPNTISVDGVPFTPIDLKPGQLLQQMVSPDMVGNLVIGTAPFLALFGHACAFQYNCTCGLLYTPLWPHYSHTSRFIVPPVFTDEAEHQTYLLQPSVPEPVEFTADSGGSFEMSGPSMLHRPGLLLNLIPEAEFGSCFAVHTESRAMMNWAVIVASAASTGDVLIGMEPVEGEWTAITGTDFKYIKVPLNHEKNFIWNKSGQMTVWFIGKNDETRNAWFGHPAARLSKDPDLHGCLLEPEKLEVLPDDLTWKEAVQACENRDLTLLSLSDQNLQDHIYSRIVNLMSILDLMEVWMGLRKSSYSGEWYWVSQEPLMHVDWSPGSPGDKSQGKCGRISLADSTNPGWVHRNCCTLAKAVCYQPSKLLRMADEIMSEN